MANVKICDCAKNKKQKKKNLNKSCFILLCVFGIQFACSVYVDGDKAARQGTTMLIT